LVAWWVVGAVAGPLAGRLQEVQKNDNAAFLPASAESTEVNQLQQKFAQTETFPLAVLFVRDGQVTAADQQYVASYAGSMAAWPLVDTDGKEHSGGKTVGDYLAGGGTPQVVPSQDGKALLVNASVDADSISKALPDSTSPIVAIVETLRYHA